MNGEHVEHDLPLTHIRARASDQPELMFLTFTRPTIEVRTRAEVAINVPFSFAWMDPAFAADALCKEYPDVDFFPERGESNEPAKAVCGRCLVQAECLAFAIDERIEHGIWAGTSARQRRTMQRPTTDRRTPRTRA